MKNWTAKTRLAALRSALRDLSGSVEKAVTDIYEKQIAECEAEVAKEKEKMVEYKKQQKLNSHAEKQDITKLKLEKS